VSGARANALLNTRLRHALQWALRQINAMAATKPQE